MPVRLLQVGASPTKTETLHCTDGISFIQHNDTVVNHEFDISRKCQSNVVNCVSYIVDNKKFKYNLQLDNFASNNAEIAVNVEAGLNNDSLDPLINVHKHSFSYVTWEAWSPHELRQIDLAAEYYSEWPAGYGMGDNVSNHWDGDRKHFCPIWWAGVLCLHPMWLYKDGVY